VLAGASRVLGRPWDGKGAGITECELPLAPFLQSRYFRVTVVDAAGKRAWTNFVWLD